MGGQISSNLVTKITREVEGIGQLANIVLESNLSVFAE